MVKRPSAIGYIFTALLLCACLLVIAWYAIEGRRWSHLGNLPEGEDLARRLVDEGRPASDCYKTYQIVPSYPPLSEAREYCVRYYAKFTHDPSACELLMPSEYGLSCLNNVMSDEFTGNADAEHVTLEQCQSITGPSLKHDNCLLKAAHKTRAPQDCAGISNEVIRSGCTLKLQAWQEYPHLRTSLEFGQGQ